MSQDQIALAVGYSRATVSRMLEEARRGGIVRIQVSHPQEHLADLERIIASRFGANHVLVTANSTGHSGIGDVARACQQVLDRTLAPGVSVGLSNGRIHRELVENLRPQHQTDLTVVQMVGSLGASSPLLDGPNLCRRFAAAYGASYRTLEAPFMVENARTATDILSQPRIASTLQMAAKVDMAILGIGAGLHHPAGIFASWLTDDHVRTLRKRGAIGHLLGQFLNREGDVIDNPLKDLVIGMAPQHLRNIPHVVALAAGTHKAAALAAALQGGLVNSLVLDVDAAQALAYFRD